MKFFFNNFDKKVQFCKIIWFGIECPAEFCVTEFRQNFAEFFARIPPELSYGIPYFLRNSVCMRNSAFLQNSVCYGIPYFYGIPWNAEFRILRNSVTYGIPYIYGILYTEFRNVEFHIYEIPQCGIPYFTKFHIAEFRIPSIRNFYEIPPEFHIPYHAFRQKKIPPEFFVTE